MPENRGSSRGPDAWLSGLVAPAHARGTSPAPRLDDRRADGPPRVGPCPRLLPSMPEPLPRAEAGSSRLSPPPGPALPVLAAPGGPSGAAGQHCRAPWAHGLGRPWPAGRNTAGSVGACRARRSASWTSLAWSAGAVKEQTPRSVRRNSRPNRRITRSFLSLGSKLFRLEFFRSCSKALQ
jgi:hypothetical protein